MKSPSQDQVVARSSADMEGIDKKDASMKEAFDMNIKNNEVLYGQIEKMNE